MQDILADLDDKQQLQVCGIITKGNKTVLCPFPPLFFKLFM